MSLHRKLLLINAALIVGLATLGGALLWGLWGLHRTIDETNAEYEELRIVEAALLHVSAARTGLMLGAEGPIDAERGLRDAQDDLQRFLDFQVIEGDERAQHQDREVSDVEISIAALRSAQDGLRRGDRNEAVARLDVAMQQLRALAAETDISGAVAEAHTQMSVTTVLAGTAAAVMILGAGLARIAMHRAVMRPLRRLRDGVRTLASGRFEERVEIDADPEFAALAEDFNQMGAELQDLYRNLEAKVAVKSRELAQSERLASVGYLAAGVAHEINNPLSILSGYAELCRGWLKEEGASPSPAALGDARQALKVIAEEAQRCKEITSKLLSMARMGDGPRDLVSLSRIARDVAGMMDAFMRQRRVRMAVSCDPESQTRVLVNAAEIRQIVLNLLVNALDAVSRSPIGRDARAMHPEGGRIDLSVRGVDGHVELAVQDNGCGMAPDVLERVFEPFFTTRDGGEEEPSPRRGVGLGLSISHAIAEGHGGSLRASSAGPGRGSRFVLSLPAASAEGRSSNAA